MRNRRTRQQVDAQLEETLRTMRARAPRRLSAMIEEQLAREPLPRPSRLRLGAAVAVSVGMLALFGALGGVGRAASTAAQVARTVQKVTGSTPTAPAPASSVASPSKSSSDGGDEGDDEGEPSHDQYKPGKGCGDKNHVHFKEGECKKGPK
jgi:hypothetical protein